MFDRLPYDIFRQIIRNTYTKKRTKFWYPYDGLETLLPPFIASRVCQSWRHALLSDPTMWTCLEIPQMKPDEILEIISRSGQLPLSVFIRPNNYGPMWKVEHQGTLSSLFQELYRFEILEICVDPLHDQLAYELVRWILSYINRPASKLHSFYLRIKYGDLYHGEELMDTLFSGDAPNLSHVSWQISFGIHELLRTPLIQNLTSLHLLLETYIHLHFDFLFDVLELSPRLQELEIAINQPTRDSLPEISPPFHSNRQVNLPCLTRLFFNIGNLLFIANIVCEHLLLPPTVHYNITSSGLGDTIADAISSSPFLSQIHPTSSTIYFIPEYVSVDLWKHRQGSEGSIHFAAKFDKVYELVDTFSDLMHAFKLSSITQLDIHYAEVAPKSTVLREVFASMMNLDSLTITHYCWDINTDSPASTSVLTALASRHIGTETRTILKREAGKKVGSSNITPHYNILDYNVDGSDSLDDCSSAYYILPCPFLRTLEIASDEAQLDAAYAALVCACSDGRRAAGYPIEEITIHCRAGALTEEAKVILRTRENFPIKLLIEDEYD